MLPGIRASKCSGLPVVVLMREIQPERVEK